MIRALVTAIGSFSSDIVIKSLKRMGMYVIGTNIYPKEWIAEAYEVNKFYNVPRTDDEEMYISQILKLCTDEHIQYLLPLTDVEVDALNKHREEFKDVGTKLCISPYKTILLCRNKYWLTNFIAEKMSDIKVIPTYICESSFEPETYPVVCKPLHGRSSIGLKYIHSKCEWEKYDDKSENIIVQPYIEGDIVTVDIVKSSATGQCVAIARKELLRTLNGAGISVYVFHDEKLEEMCCRLADKLGIEGCVNFEFIIDSNGEYHFLECNPRFSGGVEFSCMAGYECVCNHINAFNSKGIDEFVFKHNFYITRKYEEYVTSID